MLRRRLGHVLWIICSLSVAGCDPVRTTLQPVRLRVVDSASGQPVPGAQVSLKYDFETAEPLSEETGDTRFSAEEWHQDKRKFWDEFPWFSGVTDKNGQATINAEYTGIDRTWGSKPPSWADRVTGKPFLVKVEAGAVPEEELTVPMKRGASVKGKVYTVTVIDIQEPRYVPTRE